MKIPRFYMTDDYGLILESAIPLSPRQREACRQFAIKEYKRRLIGLPAGNKRDALVDVITRLIKNNFIERMIPQHDCDKEAIIHG